MIRAIILPRYIDIQIIDDCVGEGGVQEARATGSFTSKWNKIERDGLLFLS